MRILTHLAASLALALPALTGSFAAATAFEASVETCGDGIIQQGEQCDDGNNTNGDGCDQACRAE
jgi:cysteine-rich repeat protein